MDAVLDSILMGQDLRIEFTGWYRSIEIYINIRNVRYFPLRDIFQDINFTYIHFHVHL